MEVMEVGSDRKRGAAGRREESPGAFWAHTPQPMALNALSMAVQVGVNLWGGRNGRGGCRQGKRVVPLPLVPAHE